ncbi:acyltransferase domain-containing protein, partial [Streptomyces sp. ADMS]|uniref:acyltransferase domain-containing protein n=1 Tax=Streptomyces sp. ADMS TaxID=3071415 RepID=UPI00296F161F
MVFVFSGQGPQYVGMGRELYGCEPVFRSVVDECAGLVVGLTGVDVRELLFAPAGDVRAEELLGRTQWAQPVLFTVEYALARLWESWGISPVGMVGHSLGELTAACVAGVFSLSDAVALVVERGRLMEGLPAGAMCSVVAGRDEVVESLPEGVWLAAHNGPRECVVSGSPDAVRAYAEWAAGRGWSAQTTPSGRGFHSGLMDPVVSEFARLVSRVERNAPVIPFISGVTGDWITAEQACDPEYWGGQARHCVEFAAGVTRAAGASDAGVVFVEVGPGQTFSGLVRRILRSGEGGAGWEVTASLPHRRDRRGAVESMQRALAQLWVAGVEPDWEGYYQGRQRRRVPLPTYPFARTRHWLDEHPTAPPTP